MLDLIITADTPNLTADFWLLDDAGVQLASNRTEFKNIAVSDLHGLFDLRNYLRNYIEDDQELAAIASIGVCIAEAVLGQEIFGILYASKSQRTLRIQLPGAQDDANLLAAALARVPWEIARPSADAETLAERNVLVRVVHDMHAPASAPIPLKPDEALRVLFIFAEARGSTPLGARRERLELMQLFAREIYPQRRIVAHFLTHGVTRERLEEQITENGGYHVVHWSGHGGMNVLELCKPGGASDHLTGQELLDLFVKAGGLLPQLFFLSACHSGDILRVKDWAAFLAIAKGKEPGTKHAEPKDLDLTKQPGYTGTAHALLQDGVPSVVAMRYAVGDDYAREIAVEFYRALFAHAQPKNVAAALTIARQAMRVPGKHDLARFDVCDHATPVLYGADALPLAIVKGVSPEKETRNRRLPDIGELKSSQHEHFVGRTWELAGLGAGFIGAKKDAATKPIAVVTGLGGMGKTALAAEALALWETRFEWVLLFQAKPALSLDNTLRDIHTKLHGEVGRYHAHVAARPADSVYRAATAEFTGPARFERLTRNLVRALKDEPILIVLDNFEENLKPHSTSCQDPAWHAFLATLAKELIGSPSRVLITCRRPLAALAGGAAYPVGLGPLPAAEAALYLKDQPTLSRMIFGTDVGEKALAYRLLSASRFHPLLMDRLARLAADPAHHSRLLAALEALEKTKDFSKLPELFTTQPGDQKTLAYLDDALAVSLDHLIHDASPDARRLLWIIAIANQPEALDLVRGVWSGENHEEEQLRQIKELLDNSHKLPPEAQAQLNQLATPEFRAELDALPPAGAPKPDLMPLLRDLVAVGLVNEERTEVDDENPNLAVHELVRERIRAWMKNRAEDRADLTADSIRHAYAALLESTFKGLLHQNMTTAMQAGIRALVYCVQAKAWDRLAGFSSVVVTSARDPQQLAVLAWHLKAAANSAPAGEARWTCLCSLADALRQGGHSDQSLPYYEQAASEAHAVAEAGGEDPQRAWADVAWIYRNWATALRHDGQPDEAHKRWLDSEVASKRADTPAIYDVASELENLRIDIMEGKAREALPEVESRLEQVEKWWRTQQSGQPVPEAPDEAQLARTYIDALDIAAHAHAAQEDFPAALGRVDAIIKAQQELKRTAEDIAAARMNRANLLCQLHPPRYPEAKMELEACLATFQNDPTRSAMARGVLANIFALQGDIQQAITQQRRVLAHRESLPDPEARASSHYNLASALERSGTTTELAESRNHRLATFIYQLVAKLGENLKTTLHKYAFDFRQAQAAGTELSVPRVSELLAAPAFAPLAEWLIQRQVPLADIQAAVDQLHAHARKAASASANLEA